MNNRRTLISNWIPIGLLASIGKDPAHRTPEEVEMRKLVSATVMGVRLASVTLAGYWCLIFVGTHYPKMRLPGFTFADKVYHCIAYAGLSFLLAWAIPRAKDQAHKHLWIALAIAICYGAFDELTQSLVRGRSTEFLDFVADAVGAVIGIAAYLIARRVMFRHPAATSVQ